MVPPVPALAVTVYLVGEKVAEFDNEALRIGKSEYFVMDDPILFNDCTHWLFNPRPKLIDLILQQ